jgi:glycerol-3-phosphate dehydrogenase
MYDIAIIGGGINGCGIARDAAGRGYRVFLAEKGDLAQGTSSGSTKLIHGGLRYLEEYEFKLVREAPERARSAVVDRAPHHLADAVRAAAHERHASRLDVARWPLPL